MIDNLIHLAPEWLPLALLGGAFSLALTIVVDRLWP
jgi:hypothetical protein